MKVKWFGQSTFLIISEYGLRVITDPYDPAIGYKDISETADVVTISHEHRDHNYAHTVKGNPEVVREPGIRWAGGVQFTGINTWHDQSQGKQRGNNTIFSFTVEGINICHMGDLGHILNTTERQALGPVDLLLLPVGGFFTIDAFEAGKIVADLNPRIVIPMHYRTETSGKQLAPVEDFLVGKENVTRPSEPRFEVTLQMLPLTTQIVVLQHTR